MAQQAWQITGHYGKVYQLGLFHGDTTHHVVVHCNNTIMVIDFGVRESRTYSLFLDQELLEISIAAEGDNRFAYDCRINREAATPLNQQRQQERQANRQSLRLRLAVSGVVMLFFLLVLWLS